MIDIILLTCNRIKLLQQIIVGFEERLKTPYRLIVINNNSKDGTTEYLEELVVLVFTGLTVFQLSQRTEEILTSGEALGVGTGIAEVSPTVTEPLITLLAAY